MTAAKDGDDGGENGDDGEIGDDEPKKPEFCKVTITLKSVQVTSNRIADGTVIGNTVDTIPASKGAPGASVDVDDLVVGGDATVVDKVAREYVVPKRGGFPHRVLVSAKILRNDPFKRAFFSGPVKKIVLCPSSHDVEAIVEALLSGVGETFTLKYQIEVTEVEAQ